MSRRANVALIDPNPRLDQLKIQLCHELKSAWRRRGWNQIQAALHLGTSRACMSQVDRVKIEHLTVAQLFRYLACAAPGFEILISQRR